MNRYPPFRLPIKQAAAFLVCIFTLVGGGWAFESHYATETQLASSLQRVNRNMELQRAYINLDYWQRRSTDLRILVIRFPNLKVELQVELDGARKEVEEAQKEVQELLKK